MLSFGHCRRRAPVEAGSAVRANAEDSPSALSNSAPVASVGVVVVGECIFDAVSCISTQVNEVEFL